MIIIHLVQFTPTNVFCQSMNHTHNTSSVFQVHSRIISSIPIASLVPLRLLNANWSTSTSSIFLSTLHLSILASVFVVCVIRLIVRWSLDFVAFGIFCKVFILTSVKSLSHSPVTYTSMLLIRAVITLRQPSPNSMSTSTGPSSPVAFLSLIPIITLLRLCP